MKTGIEKEKEMEETKSLKPEFYDSIEKEGILIRKKRNELKRIKSATIKECLYTNKVVPDVWKNQLGYQNNILEIFSEDNDFLNYVGKGPTNYNTINSDFESENVEINSFRKKLPEKKISDSDKKIFNSLQRISSKYNDKKRILLPEESDGEDVKGIINVIRYKYLSNSKGKNNVSDREILKILENYRNAYPIKEKTNSLLEYEKLKEIENKLYNEKVSKVFSGNTNSNLFENVYKLKKRERIDSFRQPIYNKIIPPNIRAQTSKNRSYSKKKNEKEESKFGPFLHSNTEAFYKTIEVDNPIIKKYLENINFYGPYFSYCPPCKRRNMEFYKKMNENYAIELMKYLNKIRGDNEIIKSKNTSLKKKPLNYVNTSYTNHNNNSQSFNSDYSKSIGSNSLQKNILNY